MVALAGWMNRQQQEVIEYLRMENRILREKLGHKRIILNDSQRRRLATAAKKVGRDLLRQFGTLFSPDTILKWHRMLLARKYNGNVKRRPGPPPTKANMIRDLGRLHEGSDETCRGCTSPQYIVPQWTNPTPRSNRFVCTFFIY